MSGGAPVVWINGPYGCGKSTVSRHVAELLPDALVVDPEDVGHMLWRQLPDHLREEEFELEPAWAPLTRVLVEQCARTYGRPLVVPMTIVRMPVFERIVGALRRDGTDVRHFTLLADASTIRARLRRRMAERRESADAWGELSWEGRQLDRCLDALAGPAFGTHLWTADKAPREVARELLAHL
ncbi:AAA family ATPase [Streptomyces sp. ID05-04B]|uniref:AAA family ATPase n=1 Tax=unclassified Streptomyces TaxID=2593676 RepID=UPI00131F3CF7|nr:MULTISPECIES: AAA family ATPase [unclassified Streptomyces]MDX5565755.1 AAA family ATPase [Streptomyces sp. ID05-04B]